MRLQSLFEAYEHREIRNKMLVVAKEANGGMWMEMVDNGLLWI